MLDKPEPVPTDDQIEAAVLDVLARRGLNASACPSEVARQLQANAWRTLMPRVRGVAALLAQAGKISVTQGGCVLSPAQVWKGPIRLRLAPVIFVP
jgi:Protein of unknown function (DUF3253)